MPKDLTELLSSTRLRPLWQLGTRTESKLRAPTPGPGMAAPDGPSTADLTAALHSYIPRETLPPIFWELERLLRASLGSRALLFCHLLEPLRAAISAKSAPLRALRGHPLAAATPDSLPRLIDRMDDTLSAVLTMRTQDGAKSKGRQ